MTNLGFYSKLRTNTRIQILLLEFPSSFVFSEELDMLKKDCYAAAGHTRNKFLLLLIPKKMRYFCFGGWRANDQIVSSGAVSECRRPYTFPTQESQMSCLPFLLLRVRARRVRVVVASVTRWKAAEELFNICFLWGHGTLFSQNICCPKTCIATSIS